MDNAREFLESEVKAAERGVKITAAIGLVMSVLAVLYLNWVTSAVQEFVEPSTVAGVVTGTAADVIPGAAEQLREGLKSAAPELAATLSNAVIEAIPIQRQHLEASFADMSEEMARASAADVAMRLREIIRKDKVAGTPEEKVERAIPVLVAQLDLEVAGGSGRKAKAGKETGIFTSMNDSASYLQQLNAKLARIANSDELDPSGHATKRLITAWVGLVDPAEPAPKKAPASGPKGT